MTRTVLQKIDLVLSETPYSHISKILIFAVLFIILYDKPRMKISYNWIKDYLKIDLDPVKVAEILTGIGLEIEGMNEWVSVKGGLQGVVIGEVLTCKKHPSADKLFITTVDIGASQPLQIVCGAPNVAAGQKVPVATSGTVVHKGDESLEIKSSKIRGELSEGMICAEDELGLGNSHDGIMVLNKDVKPGTAASTGPPRWPAGRRRPTPSTRPGARWRQGPRST